MTIDELNALTTLTAADEVPVWDSEESDEPTKKITASNLAASVKSLASLPNTTEMNAAIEQSTATISGTFVGSSNISFNAVTCRKSANIGIASINVTMAAIDTQSSWCSIGTLSIHPSEYTYGVVTDDSGARSCRILNTGEIDIWKPVARVQYIGNISFIL
jgi:hypothetical protein